MALANLVGHAMLSGCTGSGKSMAAVLICQQLVRSSPNGIGIGVIDAKGELVERLQKAVPLDHAAVLDFNSRKPVAYGLLVRRADESAAELVERRMEVFDDVLGRDNQTSLRMGRMLRNVLVVSVENDLPFFLVDYLLSNVALCRNLGIKASDNRVSDYFQHDFDRERNSTLPALQSRLDFLLRHEHLRVSFSAETCLDFGALMEAHRPILVNAGGPGMPRALSRVIQSLLASDLRRAIFSRVDRDYPYLWFIDEAQELFKRPSDVENLTALLTMSRSYGAYLALMTQSPTAACPHRDFLQQLVTNVTWMLMLRSANDDARLIEPGLPVSGRQVGYRSERGRFSYLRPEQERQAIMEAMADLPNQTGYLWVRGTKRPAIKCRLSNVETKHAEKDAVSKPDPDVHVDYEHHVRRLQALAMGTPRPARPARASLKCLSRLEQHLRAKANEAS